MPKGSPNKQTIASEKYQKKAGYMSKSYKLRSEVVQEFEAVCKAKGVSQASQLTRLMQEFIELNK